MILTHGDTDEQILQLRDEKTVLKLFVKEKMYVVKKGHAGKATRESVT